VVSQKDVSVFENFTSMQQKVIDLRIVELEKIEGLISWSTASGTNSKSNHSAAESETFPLFL